MITVTVSVLDVARRFIGVSEDPGAGSNPLVLAMLQRNNPWVKSDDTAWCGAFVGFIAEILGLPFTRKLSARAWLAVGTPVHIEFAEPGDVVIMQRGYGPQPGPEVLDAPGHVAFFVALEGHLVRVVGGNQGDAVTEDVFHADRVLGVRRLH